MNTSQKLHRYPYTTMRYEDWLQKSQFEPLELALLMTGIAPHFELGRDILEYIRVGEDGGEFRKKYKEKCQLWRFYEWFCEARNLIFRSVYFSGSLKEYANTTPVYISREAAIKFVIEVADAGKLPPGVCDGFLEAAKSQMSCPLSSPVESMEGEKSGAPSLVAKMNQECTPHQGMVSVVINIVNPDISPTMTYGEVGKNKVANEPFRMVEAIEGSENNLQATASGDASELATGDGVKLVDDAENIKEDLPTLENEVNSKLSDDQTVESEELLLRSGRQEEQSQGNKKSRWWHNDFEYFLPDLIAECERLSGDSMYRGKPNWSKVSREMAKKINDYEHRRALRENRHPRSIGFESIRQLLKPRFNRD